MMKIEKFSVPYLCSSMVLKDIALSAVGEFIMLHTKQTDMELGLFAEERFISIAEDTGADMLYSDHYQLERLRLQ